MTISQLGSKSGISKDDALYAGLTPSERSILKLLAQGLTNQAIADKLSLSEKTIRNTVTIIFQKLCVFNRTQAAVWFLANVSA
jgi:DNA-binding NarL/FixJ family response regulator